ncbi:hypothetical protein PLICRDRAFT_37272 [Plicaturopsis crispa FD-325 SS-3]|nr:hypothetical protein PLICRDRAFT_37272 [Plicaturopsis crispa FD-325 SS-3]
MPDRTSFALSESCCTTQPNMMSACSTCPNNFRHDPMTRPVLFRVHPLFIVRCPVAGGSLGSGTGLSYESRFS